MNSRIKNQVLLAMCLLTLFFSTLAHGFSFNYFDLKKFFHGAAKPQMMRRPIGHHKEPVHIKVGVYVLHVGKYDFQDATYQMDFYLIFKCKPLCRDINFEIMNATTSNVHVVSQQQDSLIYRIQAELNRPDNLRNYPFDSHTLDIVLEDRQLTNDKIVFETDPTTTALDSDLTVVGFNLLPTWTASVGTHYYSVFQRTFSSYKFSMLIQRPWLAGFLKGILPALIIVSCNFLALFMRIDQMSQRLSLTTSTLIAAVVFHLNLTASIPPLGYVTYADMFMLMNYLLLFTVLIEVVITTYLVETKHRARAEHFNATCAWVVPIAWFILQLIVWFTFDPANLITSSGAS